MSRKDFREGNVTEEQIAARKERHIQRRARPPKAEKLAAEMQDIKEEVDAAMAGREQPSSSSRQSAEPEAPAAKSKNQPRKRSIWFEENVEAEAQAEREAAAAEAAAAEADSIFCQIDDRQIHASWKPFVEALGCTVADAWAVCWPEEDIMEAIRSFKVQTATAKRPTLFMFHSFNPDAYTHCDICAKRCLDMGLDVHLVRGLDPTSKHAADLMARLKVQNANRARTAWTFFGLPYILHCLSIHGLSDHEWFFVAEDSCFLFTASTLESMQALTSNIEAFPEFARQAGLCGYQLAYRRLASTKRTCKPLDPLTGKEITDANSISFRRAIGAKLFLVQGGWLRLLHKASLQLERTYFFDHTVGLMRSSALLLYSSPIMGGSARHFSLVDGGRMQEAEMGQ
ncbi:unnamed protein product [Symbiodinium sp. CCMP2592]|nr:unnamed protein product [Symbiodinium sp. CCMP2592]